MNDKTGIVFYLLLLILLVWLFITGRITGAAEALAGRKVAA